MAFWHLLETHGERPALITHDQTLSYADLAAQADCFAVDVRALLPAGLTHHLIPIETANEIMPILTYLGALRAGGPVKLLSEPDRLPFSERHHYPLAALQLLGLGRNIYFACSHERQLGVAALLAAVWLITWHGAPPQVTGW